MRKLKLGINGCGGLINSIGTGIIIGIISSEISEAGEKVAEQSHDITEDYVDRFEDASDAIDEKNNNNKNGCSYKCTFIGFMNNGNWGRCQYSCQPLPGNRASCSTAFTLSQAGVDIPKCGKVNCESDFIKTRD